jgi:SepF-like predicted cell division protein (DUF552 family)
VPLGTSTYKEGAVVVADIKKLEQREFQERIMRHFRLFGMNNLKEEAMWRAA